ncbi:hypothetical protein B0O99DRAFT_538530 [Bisporella sp. PMI_857]|nr:hypothetical protein B0O99DRAFT_538530 [Bisporella sp. PMI_857]
MIVEEISRQKYPGWAFCAAVCKEWRAVVERKNFHRLILQASCLEELENMVTRQRDLVQYICLNIELPRYTSRSCQQTESFSCSSRHSSIVADAILKLFSVLSTWQPTGCLILELNAYSLSDSEHWFKNYYFGLEHENGDLVQPQEATTKWHDPNHGWVNGQQVEAPRAPAILRLFSPICLSLSKNLPEVHAVTGFAICRQLRRQISPVALRLLWERLPQLETIVYEPWRVWRRSWKILCDKELASVIQDALPSHVKTVSIFEEFNDQLALALRRDTPYLRIIDTSPNAGHMLVRAFASKSLRLERLSISYMIDAQQFFESCQPSYTWHHLQSLTLTSSILAQTARQKEISALLHDASLAALNMPQLESMVFWNSKHGEACAVIYQRIKASSYATLTWRGTWDFELSHDVVKSWQKVASDSYHLRIKNERVQGFINSHGDAIHHLHLPARVIDPASLWQIRQEGMMQRMA